MEENNRYNHLYTIDDANNDKEIELTLYSKDIPLLDFKAIKDKYGYEYKVEKVYDVNIEVLPMLLQPPKFVVGRVNNIGSWHEQLDKAINREDFNNNAIEKWIVERNIPTSREHIENLLKSLNIDEIEPLKLLLVNYGTSLNDTYWLKESHEQVTYADINLYHNEFKDALGVITFFGNTSSLGGKMITPEITTQGMLGKCWKREDGEIYLYKKGSSGGANTGFEPVSEYIASEIARIIGIPHVTYELVRYEGVLCTKCKCFTTEDIGLVTMHDHLRYTLGKDTAWTLKRVVEILKNEVKQDALMHFEDMLVFDYIIENKDRHMNNFGLLKNNNTGKLID